MPASPNVNLTQLKRELAQAILEQEHLQCQLGKGEGPSEDALSSLETCLGRFSEQYLLRARTKQLRIKNHKLWKQRRKEKLKKERLENGGQRSLEKPEKSSLSTELIPSAVTSAPLESAQLVHVDAQHSHTKTHDEHGTDKLRVQQLTAILHKLSHIRDLRRRKLETKGHFFPETGDAFYDKIKAETEIAGVVDGNIDEDDSNSVGDSRSNKNMVKQHAEDAWQDQSLDMDAYRYWSQGWQDTDKLRLIRENWDKYLVTDNNYEYASNAMQIPPSMVMPSSPSNRIWAMYLK